MQLFYNAIEELKKSNTVMVMDIDDSWDLSPTHPLYNTQKQYHLDDLVKKNLGLFEYVTTTTPLFADEIKPYNANVMVLPNAIDPNDERFKINRKDYSKIRVGFVMGSAHEEDVRQMGNFISKLKPEVLDKIQVNLCGFDLRGTVKMIDPRTNNVTERPIQPKETTWYRYENMVTNNRKILNDKYKKFLNMYVPNLEYPNVENEHYRRCWTKDMNHYFSHYENIDILYAPLEVKHFNYVKSQLKAIECCFSNTAIIAQNYGPYTIDLKHAIDENGKYNGGNALLVDTDKNETDWVKFTEILVENPELLTNLKNNIHESLKDLYNLNKVTADRAEFYKSILKGKK
jgi:glycosyltransferase involved in cell wall biosynthesis